MDGCPKNGNNESNTFIDSLKSYAAWDKMVTGRINKSETFMYVPININSNTTGLVFVIDSRNQVIEDGYISEIAYKPNSPATKPVQLIADFYKYKKLDFTGTITGYSIINKFLWEMGYKNGNNNYKKKIVNLPNGILGEKNIGVGNNIKVSGSLNTTARCTAFYLVTYWSDGSIDYEFIGGFCDGGGCEQTRIISKNEGVNLQTACGGGGGGGGNGTSSIENVINKIDDPCLKSVVQKIVNSNLQNAVTDILQTVFSVSEKVNITFLSSTTYPTPGHTVGLSYNSGQIEQTIYLNPQLMSGSSQEFDASIIIHEIIHSALNVKGVNSSLQHPEMLKNYIDKMSSSLVSFFPMLTLQQARSLSLQGLGPDVISSSAFDAVLQLYGFNKLDNSPYNFANFALQHQYGSLGVLCGTQTSGGTP